MSSIDKLGLCEMVPPFIENYPRKKKICALILTSEILSYVK